jgi:DNA polymerase-1
MVITSAEDLRELVKEYMRRDEFVFDLETRFIPPPDQQAEAERLRELSPKERSVDEKAWLVEYDMRATDERLNEVIWFGLATLGRSDSVACGHPNGVMLKPARIEKVSVQEVYPEGHPKRTTKSGMPSWAKVPRSLPAVFGPPPPQVRIDQAIEILEPLMFSERRKVNQNLRFDIRSLVKYYGTLPPGPYGELQVALHLLDENRFLGWDLENFVDKVLGHTYDKLGKKGVTNFSFAAAARYAEQDARFTWLLWTDARRRLHKNPVMWELFEFEMEVAQALRDQEIHGIKVNTAVMNELRARYEATAQGILDRLITDYGASPTFNPNATLQKAALLYDQLGAKTVTYTPKTANICVDAKALKGVVAEGGPAGEAAGLLLTHAEHAKVIGTYFVGMSSKLHEDDYLYPSFNQHQTVTGRLSCYMPNLHNIPRGSDIRAMFIPEKGEVMIAADYDQIELRFICMYAEDETMRDLFLGDEDIHTATAARIRGVDPTLISKEERTVYGKTPNFLIGYGGGAYRLHQQTGIEIDRAQEIIDRYFKTFRRILPWKMRELSMARSRARWVTREDGRRRLASPPYVETMLGRRRRIPALVNVDPRRAATKEEWKKLNAKVNAAERQAINAIVQGSAADTIKLAMVDIRRHLAETGFPLTPVLNVHDEIVAVCPEEYAEEGLKVLVSRMEGVVNYRTGEPPLQGWVPLLASGTIGDRWAKS